MAAPGWPIVNEINPRSTSPHFDACSFDIADGSHPRIANEEIER